MRDRTYNKIDLSSVTAETDKIDGLATDGLTGVSNSLAYRVHEIERHLHSYARWFGAAVTPDAELHVADEIGVGVTEFQLNAGDNDWGAWVQILGSDDTPVIAGNTYFDLHLIQVDATQRAATYFIQIAEGVSGAAGLAAGTYADLLFTAQSNQIDASPATIQTRRVTVGTKAWARCMVPGVTLGTIDFFIGLHEYEG